MRECDNESYGVTKADGGRSFERGESWGPGKSLNYMASHVNEHSSPFILVAICDSPNVHILRRCLSGVHSCVALARDI